MQSEERELITSLFGRLQPFESQPRDGEAEALIKDLAARQPAAPYLLVQTVLVQEQALKAAQERIAELEARAAPRRPRPVPALRPRSARGARLLHPLPPRRRCRRHGHPCRPRWGRSKAAAAFCARRWRQQQRRRAGALLFEGIRGLMGNNPGPFGQAAAAQPAPLLPQDNQQAAADNNPVPDELRNEDYDTAAYDDGDTGGSDDWA